MSESGTQRGHKAAIVHQIRMLMEYWSIEPEELAGAASPADPVSVVYAVKYRHPASGETWDGQGAHPQWLRDALLKQGYTVAELRAAAEAAQ